jgi:hypothetical protein
LEQTDVSEVLTASIIALTVEAVRTSETSTSTRLHGGISQKAIVFMRFRLFETEKEGVVTTCSV